MKLYAVEVVTSDFKKAVEFYTLLGFAFPKYTEENPMHIEGTDSEGGAKLLIDDKEMITKNAGFEPKASNYSMCALKYESSAKVDEMVELVRSKGFRVAKEPWDAFWGQRYAVVVDPDGYGIDLFAALK